MKIYKIYTDGSTKGNGKNFSFGGWAYAIYNEDGKLVNHNSGAEYQTTNNRMELMAIINAIKGVKEYEFDKVEIYTDSAYIHNCFKDKWYVNWQKNGWINSKKEPVKNKELWEMLIPYFDKDMFMFCKVKGHANSKENNFVDELAVAASTKIQQEFKVWE
jgi:ribonuclease HI